MSDRRKNNSLALNAGLLLAIVFYGMALYLIPVHKASFHFDDTNAIINNAAIRTIDLPRIFDAFNTRSLVGLSFALNYKWGALNPDGYRSVNIIIHCLNAFLVYLLARSTLYLYAVRREEFFQPLAWPAFFAAFLFLCHPIATEPVNFITQRFVLMGTFFYLLTMVLYIQYRCRSGKRYLIAAMASAVAAMFCKEFVVTLPLMLALYDLYFLPDEALGKRCRGLLPFFAVVLIVPALLSRTSAETVGVARIAESGYVLNGDSQRVISHVDITRANGSMGRRQYFLTELHVMCTYVRLLFLPVNQNVDYDYPLADGPDSRTAICGFFLLCLLALAVALRHSYRMISFAIFWFFIALSVESTFIPIGHVIAEYRLYLASVGFDLLVMALIYTGRAAPKKLNIIAAVIVVAFSVLTFQRNKVWRDEFTLWNDVIKKSPQKPRAYNNRGNKYLSQGDLARALADYDKAIAVEPSYAQSYINRGVIYAKQKKFALALADDDRAIAIDPGSFERVYYNRAFIYTQEGDHTLALADYNKAIEINPAYVEAYTQRGDLEAGQGNFTQAMSDFNKVIELDPQDAEAYNNLGSIYDKQRNLAQARADYDRAVEIDPQYKEAYYNRSYVHAGEGDLALALQDCNKAIEIDPRYAEAYDNRGVIYARQNNIPQALSDFNKAILFNPRYAEAYNNRGLIYNKQKDLSLALADYDHAIELNPDYTDAYNNRGDNYYKQGDFLKALSDFNRVIAAKPHDPGVYYNRAVIYYQLKEYGKAWEDIHKLERLGGNADPRFMNALEQASGKG